MNLMNEINHRPWPLPSKNWIMRQTWSNLLFCHWPVPSENLRSHIPPSLQIDTFNRFAWVGIVLFVMEGIYPRGLSFVKLVRKFPEINVRTYVQYQGKPGVYFLSLDVDNWASLKISKKWYRLNYHAAQITYQKEGDFFQFQSTRQEETKFPVTFIGEYAPISEVFFAKEGMIDHWLTERYCLYSTDHRGNIYCGEIHHRPWPLQKADAEISRNTLFSPLDIDISGVQPLFHYSKGIDALFWNIKKISFL